MKALITGASSGIGEAIADELFDMGCNLVLVARNKEKLEELKKRYGRKAKIIEMDLSSTYNCMQLYDQCKNDKIDVVVNNAGFGDCGYFDETDLNKELNMIEVNIIGMNLEIETISVINEEIEQILDDIEINTILKGEIDGIIFSDLPINKKRIEIRKLRSKGLEIKYINMFLELLEFIEIK